MTHKAQIIAANASNVQELSKVHEAEEEETGKSERYLCNPREMG